jgi:hypothetical protein
MLALWTFSDWFSGNFRRRKTGIESPGAKEAKRNRAGRWGEGRGRPEHTNFAWEAFVN